MDPHPADAITVRPFRPEDQDAVKSLILAGLEEHWGTLDPSLNPDLDNIAQSYGEDLFLVAYTGDRIVGTGALCQTPAERDHVARTPSARIVRMSVATGMRRRGIGRLILNELCAQARIRGVRRLILETTSTWREVIAFYEGFGFQATYMEGEDTYFEMAL